MANIIKDMYIDHVSVIASELGMTVSFPDIDTTKDEDGVTRCRYCNHQHRNNESEWCGSKRADKSGEWGRSLMICTREAGHSGPHVACNDSDDHCIIMWSEWFGDPDDLLVYTKEAEE